MAKSHVIPMPYKNSRIIVALLVVTTGVAEAQISPGGGMGPGMGQQPSGEEKKEGVAEEAPKTPGLLPTTPALPAPKGRRKRWKLFEIDGYFRLRTDWFKNFNLGFYDRAQDGSSLGGAPFPRALGCYSDNLDHPCGNLSGANMRLRLEPTINIDEGTSVHVQADVLDNLVLGSTPTGTDLTGVYSDTNLPPLGAFGSTQDPPTAGVNSNRDAITVKRAWAEVAIPLGILKFGRQPDHWGMGMFHNGGGHDPIAGTYDLDADYGDTVDRVSFSAQIPGTQLRAMLAADWGITRLTSNQTAQNKGHEGHPFDLDDSDDQDGWVAVISKMDSPQEFKDTVDRGDVALNYGVYFEYKTQSWDNNLNGFTLGGSLDPIAGYVPRGMKTYTPDLWGKLGYGRWSLEGEFVAQLGKISRVDDLNKLGTVDIRKYGGTGRVGWKGLEGKLRLGLETGAASGDQWDNTPQGNTNIAYANLLRDLPHRRLLPHRLEAQPVHLQPRVQGRHDPVPAPDRRRDQRGLRQAVPPVRPDQVDHLQGRERHVVRTQADRHARQLAHVRHRVRFRRRIHQQRLHHRHLVRRPVPVRRDGAPGRRGRRHDLWLRHRCGHGRDQYRRCRHRAHDPGAHDADVLRPPRPATWRGSARLIALRRACARSSNQGSWEARQRTDLEKVSDLGSWLPGFKPPEPVELHSWIVTKRS
ncbi:MAG: TIGR04551 family protein [Myxococcales bacterium]|nr:TIGR04551 family protein [Myxococcales bacterium]